jgi:hypothetical protein
VGWVKAPSYRLASRAVNALRAGVPVHKYEDLNRADLIVVSVPRELESYTIAGLALSEIDWGRKACVILDTLLESSAFKALIERRVPVATLHPIGTVEDRTLVMEGHPEAVKRMRRVLDPAASRAMQVITTSGKARLLAGVEESTRGFLPVVASVTDHFKAAGLSKSQSEVLAQALMTNSMRGYFRAGRRALGAGVQKGIAVYSAMAGMSGMLACIAGL